MCRRVSRSVLLAALLLPLVAQAQVVRLGVELQVNTHTTQYQREPAVAARADGAFVVAWASNLQDSSGYGVFARRFSSAGVALAAEFQVNTHTTSAQSLPDVAVESNGDFVVVWQSVNQEGASYGVFAQRFSSAGTAIGVEFVVNSFFVGHQYRPAVDSDADGDFVVAWSSHGQDMGVGTGIFARRFSSAGTALAVEFQVNSYTTNQQDAASVAVDADGVFVVTWSSNGQDGYYGGIFARRFSSAGTALAIEFQVNAFTLGAQIEPSIATDADGDFVVVWTLYPYEDSDNLDVFARRFTSAGATVAVEFQVNVFTTNNQERPSVTSHGAGGFLVSWESFLQDTSSAGVFARRLSNAGAAIGGEFQVHTYTGGFQAASAAAGSEGRIVVAWNSVHDGASTGIFAQRFAAPAILDLDGSLSVEPLTDGLLLLRYVFGFRGATLLSGAVDLLDCTRCDAPAIEAYLASPTFGPADRQGAEFLVNSYTPNYVFEPSVAADAEGDFVVAWSSYGRDGSNYGVFGRRFSSAGVGLAPEFQVSTFTLNGQYQSAVAVETNGDFVVAWTSNGQDGSYYGTFARRFSSAGSPLAAELQVNTYTSDSQGFPTLVADGDGDFVVAWSSFGQDGSTQGIFARRFSSSGSPLVAEFQVNTHTTNQQASPAMAIDADGDFVVVWVSEGQDGADRGIFARRFSSAGAALTGEFQVSLTTLDRQEYPSLAMDADGDFMVTWSSNLQDGSLAGVFARRFSSAGTALTGEFQVNTYTPDREQYSRVARLADDTFVIAWQDFQDGSFIGVRARRFTSTGGGLSPEFQVNSYTFLDQRFPRLAPGAGSRFIAIWRSVQDGSETSIQGQRLIFPNTFDVDGNGLVEPLTDGLLALRYLFGFRGATLIGGAVGAGCTRCDAPAIEAYLAALAS